MATTVEPALTDDKLAVMIEAAAERLYEFRSRNLFVVEDADDYVNDWLLAARARCDVNEIAFAGRSRDSRMEAIMEVVGAFVVGSGEFQSWLRERVKAAAGCEGVSALPRVERDAELERLESELAGLQRELDRRTLERERAAVEQRLAALETDEGS